MYLDRITSIFINSTSISRLVYNITVILFVFLIGFLLPEGEVSSIFKILAIIQASASLMSFGFGANIIKPLIEKTKKDRDNMMLHIIIVKIIFVILATLLISQLKLLNENVCILFLGLIGCVWSFTDIYVESMSRRLYKNYFLLKAIVAVVVLVFKVLIIYSNIDILYYVLTIEGVFPLVFLLYTHNIRLFSIKTNGLGYFKDVYDLIVYGKFIWLSSTLQIAGSRILYLIVNEVVPIKFSVLYYILLRLVEGLAFIPNNICASFFKKIILQKNNLIKRDKLRYQMLTTCLIAALVSSPMLFIVLYVYLRFKEVQIDNYFLLLPMSLGVLLFSFLRIWISREIIFNENLIASPVSYMASFLITIASVFLLAKNGIWIIICLLIYYIMSSFVPFLVNKSKMNSTYTIVKKLSHVKA